MRFAQILLAFYMRANITLGLSCIVTCYGLKWSKHLCYVTAFTVKMSKSQSFDLFKLSQSIQVNALMIFLKLGCTLTQIFFLFIYTLEIDDCQLNTHTCLSEV